MGTLYHDNGCTWAVKYFVATILFVIGPQKNGSMTAGAHILVVDDEAEIRAALGDYLGKNGFAVSIAADATEARAVLERRAVDLTILDLRMPAEDGLSLAPIPLT